MQEIAPTISPKIQGMFLDFVKAATAEKLLVVMSVQAKEGLAFSLAGDHTSLIASVVSCCRMHTNFRVLLEDSLKFMRDQEAKIKAQ